MVTTALYSMVKMIVSDRTVLSSEPFKEALSLVAVDFFNFCQKFNGGNCRQYNLNRAGKTLEAIWRVCCNPTGNEEHGRKTDWKSVLYDVKWIGEAAMFDFENNMHMPSPEYGMGRLKNEHGIEYKYENMPRTD